MNICLNTIIKNWDIFDGILIYKIFSPKEIFYQTGKNDFDMQYPLGLERQIKIINPKYDELYYVVKP